MQSNLNERIVINVGGLRFETLRKTLNNIQKGRLWKTINSSDKNDLYELCDGFSSDLSEFYFDRDPALFNFILNYYRIGKLHISSCMCPINFNNELIYWELDKPLMEVCCEEKLHNMQKEVDDSWHAYQKIIVEIKKLKMQELKYKANKFKKLKFLIWNSVDNSFDINSSLIAKVCK